jgi:hypothetical protein
VICFGTGTTAGAVAAHPGVKRLEVAEVSRAVLDLAPWFKDANRGVLDDPRTHVLVDDGRDALLLHAPDLDVITLEPLMPYSPAGLPFYTREFYELARDRLRDGGVVCQWVPVHAMPVAMFAALLRTFFEVFPDGNLWFFEQSNVLVARKGAAGPSRTTLEARFESVAADVAAAGYPTLGLLASAFVASGADVLSTPAPDSAWSARPVTDLDPWPEYHATPRGTRPRYLTRYLVDTLGYLASLTERASDREDPLGGDAPGQGRARRGALNGLRARAADAFGEGAGASNEGLKHLDEAARLYSVALEWIPGEPVVTWRLARVRRAAARIRAGDLLGRARALRAAGEPGDARVLERTAVGITSDALALDDGDPVAGQRGPAARLHALVLLRLGRCKAAERVLAEAAVALPGTSEGRLLEEWQAALSSHRAGNPAPPLPADLPRCGPEGLEADALRSSLEGWRKAVATAAPARAVRAAALGLVHAASCWRSWQGILLLNAP